MSSGFAFTKLFSLIAEVMFAKEVPQMTSRSKEYGR